MIILWQNSDSAAEYQKIEVLAQHMLEGWTQEHLDTGFTQ